MKTWTIIRAVAGLACVAGIFIMPAIENIWLHDRVRRLERNERQMATNMMVLQDEFKTVNINQQFLAGLGGGTNQVQGMTLMPGESQSFGIIIQLHPPEPKTSTNGAGMRKKGGV